ncbi:sigma-70 family RNA polymerase sigma factor [Leeuwenhoekiella sp. NPDC079379]|uniref:sigma-70 family RNA polymerase sigma factor n=1 Tax=Leeuwenhoekiella sp. NPDC079379 TaxID=3364122 RepID=UPI0037C55F62
MINENEKEILIKKITGKFTKKYRSDLFNECYITLHQILPNYDPEKANLQTYTYKHLYFSCVKFINDTKLNHQSLDDFFVDDDGDGEQERLSESIDSGENLQSEIEGADVIENLLQGKTEVEKLIINLYYFEGLSVKEILNDYQSKHLIRSSQTIRKIINLK